ncbi:MAG: ion transporter [Actinomycetota bacterium]
MAKTKQTRAELTRELALRGSIKPGYDVFIIVVTVLSIVNWVFLMIPMDDPRDVKGLLLFMEPIFTVILLGDFFFRLKLAKGQRRAYLGRGGGWLDFLGSLPYGRVLRLFRLFRVIQGFNEFGWRNTIRWFVANRAQGTFFLVLGFLIVVLEIGGVLVLWFEFGQPGSNIETGGEALWWGVVTITTVGYGDFYPVTGGGQVVATIMIFSGVALISIFTAWVASTFLTPGSSSSSSSSTATGPAAPGAPAGAGTSAAPAPGVPAQGVPDATDSGPPSTAGGAVAQAQDASQIIADLRSRLDQLESMVGSSGSSGDSERGGGTGGQGG